MLSAYRSVMHPDYNPLNRLPRVRAYQLMVVLSWMWTGIFCASFAGWAWFGELMIAHVLLLVGTLITVATFQISPRKQEALHRPTARDFPRADGTARYDDVWGG
ncbi:MAG: hypothetical protein RIC14_08685 [Filomicrobium sp.]